MSPDIVFKYFPDLSEEQKRQIALLAELYEDWNKKINVVSRKDIDELYLRHVLHSLGIAKIIEFSPASEVLDVGTGGGFPGIPLAILFPESNFTLVDSIAKKIRVVEEVVRRLGLKNTKVINSRVEDLTGRYDFVVSRAVAAMPTFVRWVKEKVSKRDSHTIKNGIFYLKGGDLNEELKGFKDARIIALKDYFEEDFFETKSVVYLPISGK
jgi:16S rRNA (guanine527-N7)-methyltransferase